MKKFKIKKEAKKLIILTNLHLRTAHFWSAISVSSFCLDPSKQTSLLFVLSFSFLYQGDQGPQATA